MKAHFDVQTWTCGYCGLTMSMDKHPSAYGRQIVSMDAWSLWRRCTCSKDRTKHPRVVWEMTQEIVELPDPPPLPDHTEDGPEFD